MKNSANKLDGQSRRKFMMNAAKSALGVSMVPLLGNDRVYGASSGGKAEHCIFLYMSGGMTHLDTFDPKPGASTQGKTGTAKTPVAGIELSEFLPGLAERFKDIALVRSMQLLTADHRGASYRLHTAYARKATIIHPTTGPWAQRLLGKKHETLPDSVLIGGGGNHPGSGFMGPLLSPLPIGDPEKGIQNVKATVDERSFVKRMKMVDTFDTAFRNKFKTNEVKAYSDFYDETLKLMKSEDLEVFDLSKEKQEKRDNYGLNQLGQGCLLAKRLVANGVRHVEVTYGGWDMHNDLWNVIPERAGIMDKAVSALIDDLKAEGLFDKTLIVLGSEFGRTPRINANGGRDHHSAVFSTMWAGGGIVGGQVYGASDDEGVAPKENVVNAKDHNATIAYAMGMPLDKVIYSPSGRPFMVAGHKLDGKTKQMVPEKQPIMQLFS
ncbi:MAG: DUF1501 domain-containing protein [Verrucomicrobiota bacterium]